MKISFLCIVMASLMPFICSGIAKWGGTLSGNKYNNHTPRNYLERLSGWPQRAQAAQLNSWEALALFTTGVLMATFAGVAQDVINLWAIIFIIARIIYIGCYIADLATLRSLIWSVGTFASFVLMLKAV